MAPEVLLTILLVLGFIVAAAAIMAVLAWTLVACFRRREIKRGSGEHSEQSVVVADGLFELDRGSDLLSEEDQLATDEDGDRQEGLSDPPR